MDELKRALCGAAAVVPSWLVLDANRPLWDQHDGGFEHRDKPEWNLESDLKRALAFYELVGGKGKVFSTC